MQISVVVCTYNGLSRLQKVLDSLLHPESVQFPDEILIVDNNSTEQIENFVTRYGSSSRVPVHYRREPRQGLMWARFCGLRESKGGIVAFIDDDNYCCKNYVSDIDSAFKARSIGYVGVHTILPKESVPPPHIVRHLGSYAVGTLPYSEGPIGSILTVWGAGMAVLRRPLLQALDAGYVPLLVGRSGEANLAGDDSEICHMLSMQGFQGYYIARSSLVHDIQASRLTIERLTAMKCGFANSSTILHFQKQQRIVLVEGNSAAGKADYLFAAGRALIYGFRDALAFCWNNRSTNGRARTGLNLLMAHIAGLLIAVRSIRRLRENEALLRAVGRGSIGKDGDASYESG